jgi:YD repeat-containing protein
VDGGRPALNYSSVYTYDLVGNRLSLSRDGNTTNYAYDANDRLTSEAGGVVVTVYTYDTNGSLVEKATGGVVSSRYTYDVRNRLASAVTVHSNATGDQVVTTTHYTYGHDGVRTSSEMTVAEGGVVTSTSREVYLNDPLNHTGHSQVFEQRDASGVPRVTYVSGLDVSCGSRRPPAPTRGRGSSATTGGARRGC